MNHIVANFLFEIETESPPLESGFDAPPNLMYYRGEVRIPEWMPSVVWNKYAQHRAERMLPIPSYHKLTIIIFHKP